MSIIDKADQFLQPYTKSDDESPVEPLTRAQTKYATDNIFELETRSYQQQYGDMYFLRLAALKPIVEKIAMEEWKGFELGGIQVQRVERVLDVRQGQLCWVTGTVYMEMSLKPNILDDISRDHFLAAPPPREKYRDGATDQVMLEDESGRLKLVGGTIETDMLVTGCVIAVMGTENHEGNFQVVEVLYPDLPPQTPRPKVNSKDGSSTRYVALASGLAISGNVCESLETHLMVEFLTGELAALNDQKKSASISRLILAGDSLAEGAIAPIDDSTIKKSSKKYGYDSTAYNPKPTANLDELMFDLCSTIPVTLMPGETDPANLSLPQQRIHPAMFPTAKAFNGTTLTTTTNPSMFEVDGVKFLGTSGQTISDIYKYVDGEDRLEMMERTLKWRHVAPTAPDTLWCYPYQDKDQFIVEECPHVYFVGNQPKYGSVEIQGDQGQAVRLITIPRFSETGQIVLLDLDTLECEVVSFKVATKENMY